MTIPDGSNFPVALDTDTNLYLVHDSLRVRLIEDYNPGDTSITIEGDIDVIDKFPPTGLITLTEQCSDIDERAISFFYGSRTDTTFDDLELLPEFTDVPKPRRITNITQNVMARHHEQIKKAAIAIEEFIGVQGVIDLEPGGDTLSGRINFLRQLVLSPRAWFKSNQRIGIIPLTIEFTEQATREPTVFIWDFGDGSSPSVISYPAISVSEAVGGGNAVVVDTDGGSISKTYTVPGIYNVKLTVENDFGSDTVIFSDWIQARPPAPDEADITISPTKARIETLINLEVIDNGESSLDPVTTYSWNLGDDLLHRNSSQTVASYSVGGLYDIKLRVDTELGSYRITTLEDSINVIERVNLWWMAFDSPKTNLATTKSASTYEFGLISEAFKTTDMPALTVTRDHSFITGSYTEQDYQIEIFRRNNSIAPRSVTTSGDKGQALVFWAEDSTTVRFRQFEPFLDTWTTPTIGGGTDTISRNWGWVAVNSTDNINLILGPDTIEASPSTATSDRSKISLGSLAVTSTSFALSNFLNGSDELLSNPDDVPATYRSSFSISNGYLASNDAGPGGFYRIRRFYRTEGVVSDFVQSIRKLADIPGTARTELGMVALTSGIFVFNNSGEVAVYSPSTNTWSTGGPGIGSASFRALQDIGVADSGEISQPIRVAGDGDRRAYLSYDYSPNAFIKFNEASGTFSSLPARPTSNEQFMLGIY